MSATFLSSLTLRLRSIAEPALLITIAGRVWQSLAGLISLYFMVVYFTPEVQGYYQTFVSLVALQWFVELGIIVAIVSTVSHEWAGLQVDRMRRIGGKTENINRLAALARFVATWFAGAALLLFVLGGSIGSFVLSKQGESDVWLFPWIATIAAAAALLWCQGAIAIIEGCNQILEVSLYRLTQAVVGSVSLWVAVTMGLGIWSLVVMTVANLVCALCFLALVYRRFLLSLLLRRVASSFDWRKDIWPMQWPLALQGLTGYFMFSLFVPVIYAYHGIVEAGRMGLSIQVVMALLSVGTTFLAVKAPRLGTMYARGEVSQFETTWAMLCAIALTVTVSGAVVAASLLVWARSNGVASATRFLDPTPFLLLLVWMVTIQLVQCAAAYWRAQKREAVGVWGVLPGLATGAAVWLLGRENGASGAAAAALGVSLLISIPIAVFFLRESRRLSLTAAAGIS